MDQRETEDFENSLSYGPYCEKCGACGEDGCCEASLCLYVKQYHRQLLEKIEMLEKENLNLTLQVENFNRAIGRG